MKLRVAWVGDAENTDSYSAREGRILVRALAREANMVPLWFALGSTEFPHIWNGVRVFPLPEKDFVSTASLQDLIAQQQPNVIVSNLPLGSLPGLVWYLSRNGIRWLHRGPPGASEVGCNADGRKAAGELEQMDTPSGQCLLAPYIAGLGCSVLDGANPTEVLKQLKIAIVNGSSRQSSKRMSACPTLVMRQHLFHNVSLAQAMFELTNALLELGVPAVPQAEVESFSKAWFQSEEDLYRSGSPEKYERIRQHIETTYDPDNAITVHFTLCDTVERSFRTFAGREAHYVTGNTLASPEDVRSSAMAFDKILAVSDHLLHPYLEAGLSPSRAAVVPHGIDPSIFCPQSPPSHYSTSKRFKFLQTSFPWVHDKGFDLTIRAFGRAFCSRDDVCLILRTPKLEEPYMRRLMFEQLARLVHEECAKPAAPEILLLESNVGASRRGGIFTGTNCYVFPLRAEGFGMTILEAMACGLPVITTCWSGPADYLSTRWAYTLRHSAPKTIKAGDGQIARYEVEPDLDHLVYLMRYVYQHPEEAKSLGQKAAQVARAHWTWKHAALKLAGAFSIPVPVHGIGQGD